MNADSFRQLYDYHFAENRKIWRAYIVPLSQEQFTQPHNYSIGSLHHHIVHLMNVDISWFSDLLGLKAPEPLFPEDSYDREAMRVHWDEVERIMRAYLAGLHDEMLLGKPISEGEDKELLLWQVLLHVVNHGTDHRAQILRLLYDLGLKTGPQDYIFHVYDQLNGS